MVVAIFAASSVFFVAPKILLAEPSSTPTTFPAPDDTVYVVAVDTDGTVYIGGEFTSVGGQTRNHIAAISSTGQLLSWNPDVDGPVYTILVSDGTVVFGGSFETVEGESHPNLAAMDIDGSILDLDIQPNDSVNSLDAASDGTLYVGGEFTQVNGQTRNHVAAVANDGTLTSWNPSANGSVASVAVSGSNVYVGGEFSTIGGQSRNNLAQVSSAGTVSSWNPGPNDVVAYISVTASLIFITGDFTQISGLARNYVAAFTTDGSLSTWNPGANDTVLAAALDGSTVYLGGFFTQLGGSTRNDVGAASTSGTLSSWNPNANGPVASIAVSGTTVYIAGNFTQIGGQSKPYVAKFTTSGSTPYPTPTTTPYPTPSTPYPTPSTPYPTPSSPYATPTGGLPYATPPFDKTLEDVADSLEYGDLLTFNDQLPVYFVGEDGLYPFATNEGFIDYITQSGEVIIDLTDDPTKYPDIIKTTSAETLIGSGSGSGSGSGGTPTAEPKVKYVTGTLIDDGGTVYLIVGNKKVAFTNFNAFNGLGYSLRNVFKANISDYGLAQTYWIDSPTITHPWSSWVKYNGTVYYVHESGLIGVPSQSVFKNNGGKEKYVLPINQADINWLNEKHNLPVLESNDSRIYK